MNDEVCYPVSDQRSKVAQRYETAVRGVLLLLLSKLQILTSRLRRENIRLVRKWIEEFFLRARDSISAMRNVLRIVQKILQ